MRSLVLLACLLLALPARAQPRDALLVFAASSLTEALQDAAKRWEAQGEPRVRFSFAASATLARQLDQGAGANLFASADLAWMDWAQVRGLIVPETRRAWLGNRLVLIAPAGQVPSGIVVGPQMDLAGLLHPRGRLPIGDPASVPAGTYARQALIALGLWNSVEHRLAQAQNARSALLLVERGEAPLGIVFATDAIAAPGVAVVARFPPGLHDRIAYPFAVPKAGDTPAARRFLAFLAGTTAGEVFSRHGFLIE